MVHETLHIGLYVIFGIIMLPVYVMFAGWLLGKPHDYRTVGLTVAYMFAFIAALIAGIAVLGTILGFFVPY